MNLDSGPRDLLVRARGGTSPLYTAEDPGHEDHARFTRNVP